MFHNYLITAFRNFVRHKLYSFINIAGLTVGLTCAIFIILFVRNELSYDRWIPGTENLYRVESSVTLPGQPPQFATNIPFVATQAMLERIPEVKNRTRLVRQNATVSSDHRQFSETLEVVDPNFLEVIRLPLIVGDPATVFVQPESVVLSQTMARKYFGDGPALGKTITVSAEHCNASGEDCQLREQPLTVTGILQDLPHNTQLVADILVPNTSRADPTGVFTKTNWLTFAGWGYVQLTANADLSVVTAKLRTIIDQSVDTKALGGTKARGSAILSPRLTRFVDDHLSTDRYGSFGSTSMTPAGNWTTVYGFMTIGVLILLVACFNFTNLATARAMIRAREISLRKVVGAVRRQIIIQFLGESLLTGLIALVLALALTEMLLPSFDRFLNTPIQFHYFQAWSTLLFIIGVGIAVGLLSGVYPAFVLSSMRPGVTLRNNAGQSGSGALRITLVVMQFAISIGLGIAVLVVSAQITFARHMDFGFRKDGILLIEGNDLLSKGRESFVAALHADSNISDVAESDQVALPFVQHENNIDVHWSGGASNELFRFLDTSPNFLRVYGMHLVAGRALSEKYGRDIADRDGNGPFNVLINSTAAKRLGYSPQSVVGKTFIAHTSTVTVVGVVADTKIHGLSELTEPTMYEYFPPYEDQISVHVAARQLPETLAFVDNTWHRFAPAAKIKRHFLDEDFEKQFLADERESDIFELFVGIAIFIACLGLFGLAAFSTERRTKEIGLRKTFGAKTRDIVWMLLWQFSIPVLIANLIAWPVAYYYLHSWLEGYAYRISLNPLYFVGAGAAALFISWATVIVHAAHVARANPVHALRYE